MQMFLNTLYQLALNDKSLSEWTEDDVFCFLENDPSFGKEIAELFKGKLCQFLSFTAISHRVHAVRCNSAGDHTVIRILNTFKPIQFSASYPRVTCGLPSVIAPRLGGSPICVATC